MTKKNTIIPFVNCVIGRMLILLVALYSCGFAAKALPLESYAEKSKLASGNWVKVSTTTSGIYRIDASTLQKWGFSNPSKVKVYGYGGARLPELLDATTYIDDLPQTPSEWVAGNGLFFYSEGPTQKVESAPDYFKPARNPFSECGYYFLTDSDSSERLVPVESGVAYDGNAEGHTYFIDNTFHEVDRVSPGKAGFFLVGEDFRINPTQTFDFQLPDIVTSEPVKLETSFVVKSLSTPSELLFNVNGRSLPSVNADKIPVTTDKYSHGNEAVSRREVNVSNGNLSVKLTFKNSSTVALANLNYISVSWARELKLANAKRLNFSISADASTPARLKGTTSKTRVWDVTNPLKILTMRLNQQGNVSSWYSSFRNQTRDYAAWDPAGTFPTPEYVENVSAQNLHGKETPDMVIFTPTEWRSEAKRLADYHSNNPSQKLKVLVLTPAQIYNEFSSGKPDVQAFRRVLKMFYDRGKNGQGRELQYALFMSRPTYDFLRKTQEGSSLGYPTLPAWFTDRGLNDNDSYTTDDIIGFLEDGSGVNIGRDQLSIAVGRLPVTSQEIAKNAVDKIMNYASRSPRGIWRNNIIMTADDQDNGEHMLQAERLYKRLISAECGSDAFIKKVYTDEFELISGRYPEARAHFYRYLDEGALWWTYQGHASPSALSSEGLVTYNDLNGLYLRHWPAVFAATCDFMRWDSPTISGAELLFNNPNGGVIAAISATRPVYISDNGHLSESFGTAALSCDENGQMLTLGQIYRQAKNMYRRTSPTSSIASNTNKLRYVLLGDPAMQLLMPANRVELVEVANTPVTPLGETDNPAILKARQQTTVKGRVVDPSGNLLSGFNGLVTATLYDAEESVTTRGNGAEGAPVTFDRQGGRLFVGTDSVRNGEFTIKVVMPAEVADNYRPAAFNLYAYNKQGVDAIGVCHDLYVYGTDFDAEPDTKAPRIKTIYLNHPSFENGQEVNASPMLLATVTDDRAINLSTAGIGHQMTLSLDDGAKTYTDVAEYFTPFTDGTPGGHIAYPLDGLSYGYHTLRLRVWDTEPNSADATVEFVVVPNILPTIYDVFTDRNPVSSSANFYISHDRPDRMLTVTVEVYNLMGRRLWSGTQRGRSDMFISSPLTWNLLDEGGRRVPRGIYLYRAIVSDEDSGEKSATASRKLAVTGLD